MFSIHFSLVMAQCVRLEVSTTMLLLISLSPMLLLVTHSRLLRSIPTTKAVPRSIRHRFQEQCCFSCSPQRQRPGGDRAPCRQWCQTSTTVSAAPSPRLVSRALRGVNAVQRSTDATRTAFGSFLPSLRHCSPLLPPRQRGVQRSGVST